MQTIFALATARGKAGVAVIRISGPDAFALARRMVSALPEPGRFSHQAVCALSGEVLDVGLVLTFEGPRSFTGEDVVEFQVHGSLAVISAVEREILQTGLARRAEAGEFTRRALSNDRMDLGQVEALGDLIEAETEQQRLAAQRALDGAMRDLVDVLRRDLLQAVALIEVTIDFADEEVPIDVSPQVKDLLAGVSDRLVTEIEGSRISERLRDGFEVAIIGPPNVGKSTLLNRIAGRDVAIISETAGTTRDILEARVDIGGLPVTFLDTAGLRESEDQIEKEGMSRARRRADQADLRLFLVSDESVSMGIEKRPGDLVLWAKGDVEARPGSVSGLTGQGIDAMMDEVQRQLLDRLGRAATANRARHREAMTEALDHLRLGLAVLDSHVVAEELVAMHLRDAIGALDGLVGAIDVEAVLGKIFSQFCIGK